MDRASPYYEEVMKRAAENSLYWYESLTLLISYFIPPIGHARAIFFWGMMNLLHSHFYILTPYPYLILLFGVLLYACIKYFLIRRKLNDKTEYVFLEITPPHTTAESAYATSELFQHIHMLAQPLGRWNIWLDRRLNYSFELVATFEKGIRYMVRIPKETETSVRQAILSFLPAAKVKTVDDYLAQKHDLAAWGSWNLLDVNLSNHYAFPLKSKRTLEEHDPIAYVTGTMTKLEPGEMIVMQLLAKPAARHIEKSAHEMSLAIINNTNVFARFSRWYPPRWVRYLLFPLKLIAFFYLTVFILPIAIVVHYYTNINMSFFPHKRWLFGSNQVIKYTDQQKKLLTSMQAKLDQPLFEVNLKVYTQMANGTRCSDRDRGIIAFINSFANAGLQSFTNSGSWITEMVFKQIEGLKMRLFVARCDALSKPSILSIDELADIYHFPFTSTTKTEDLIKSHHKEFPTPLSMKHGLQSIIFAENHYGNGLTPIGLTHEERRRHMYILGATGTGKSTLLTSMIEQDLENGEGMSVLDPHGDLIENVLNLIPEERVKDVVYFNPDDIAYPIGLNLLELTPGLSADDSLKEKEFIAESVVSLLHKAFTEKNMGPRMEYILRNTIYTAFTVEGATLVTVYKLLINKAYRKTVVKNLEDELLKEFWKNEFGKAGSYQTVQMISPITNKLGRFLMSPSCKRIMEQEKSTINFDEILDQGKILLCNLSKGKLGEGNSELLGIAILAKIQLAAMKRARVEIENRKDFYLYVDEFQNFATPAFAQILSEARKYKLNAILAHQTTSQVESSLVNVTLANTGTVICFRTANPSDEELILPQFAPNVEKGDIANLPSYHFYMRLAALEPEEAFSGMTIDLKVERSKSLVDKIITSSRELYAKKYVEADEKTKSPKTKKKPSKKKVTKDKEYYPSALG